MKNKDEELLKLGTLISEKYLLPKKHLGISSRQVNYWKNREILPFFEKEKKRVYGYATCAMAINH